LQQPPTLFGSAVSDEKNEHDTLFNSFILKFFFLHNA
jgi:hypothetical protein